MSHTGCAEIRDTCFCCGVELDEWANALQPEQTKIGCRVRPRYCERCVKEIEEMEK